jgi:cytochrome c5
MIALNRILFSRVLIGSCLALAAGDMTAHAADATPTTVTAAGVTLTSESVVFPSSAELFPGGADAQVVNANCLACHSVGMVLNQPALSKAAWQAEVTKMIKLYKAPISETNVPAIVDYLANMKAQP